MSHFIKEGNAFFVRNESALDIHKLLPAATYTVKFNPQRGGFYLEEVDGFKKPSKIYGKSEQQVARIINTFNDRTASTGVLLAGEKGSGKTLLAKLLSIRGIELGYPTIIINQNWKGEDFNQFIQNIDQPTVIIFDEFEKVYDHHEQDEILTLLDGVYLTKKLFILTCNDKWRINEHMRNRPGRLYYMLEFKGLEHDFIMQYCNEELKEKKYAATICKIATLFGAFNFDLLKALVEEMNRYNESPMQALEMLNAKPNQRESNTTFNVDIKRDGKTIPKDDLYEPVYCGTPIGDSIAVAYFFRKGDKVDCDPETISVVVGEDHLVMFDAEKGIFMYRNGIHEVTFTRVVPKEQTYGRYIDF